MPRPPRLLLSQSYYHIMTRGNNRHAVFESDEDYLYYLELLGKYKIEHPFDLFHYCLMPNHIHMLVKTSRASDFSTFMKRLNLAYFHHYRQTYGWVGHLWQDRFKSQTVGKDSYFIQCGKYIELNPVRAGMEPNPEDYQYSSYSHYANGAENMLLTDDMFYKDIGTTDKNRQKKYKEIIVEEATIINYSKRVWGSQEQRYNERNKSQKYFKRHSN